VARRPISSRTEALCFPLLGPKITGLFEPFRDVDPVRRYRIATGVCSLRLTVIHARELSAHEHQTGRFAQARILAVSSSNLDEVTT
jgi:hypothetical protein